MSFVNNVKTRSAEFIAVGLSFAEMLVGIFSETLSFTALGIFSALLSLGFFEKRKRSGRKTVVFLVSVVFFAYIAVVSFFEMNETVGYYFSAPQFWIFPVIAFL